MAGVISISGDDEKFNELRSPLLSRHDDSDTSSDPQNPAAPSCDHNTSIDASSDVEELRINALRCIECNTQASKDYTNFDECLHRSESEQILWGSSPSSMIGRSKFTIEGVCCASEIPAVNSIISPMKGVSKVIINPSTKTVFVDHNIDVVSADDIANALTKQGFLARVKIDAMEARMGVTQLVGIPTDVFVKSSFDVSTVFKTIDAVDREEQAAIISIIINQTQACLDARFSEKQVKNRIVQESEKILVIEHNPYYATATSIADMLGNDFKDSILVVSDGGMDGMWAIMEDTAQDIIEPSPSSTISVRWNILLSGLFWIVSLFSYIGGKAENLKYVALVSVALGLPPIALKAFKMLGRMHFDVNCMVLIAAVGAVALQDYTEAAAVTFLFSIGETLESLASVRARNALSSIVRHRPECANVINPITNERVVLQACAVAVGTIVSVRPGDACPCDGIIEEGQSTVDESKITGQSKPVVKYPGSYVSSGAINTGCTELVVKTTATSNNSAVARRIRVMEEAQTSGSDTEKLIDSFAKIYTPIIAFLGICMCTIGWAFGNEAGRYWTKNGLVTVAIACPCPVVISTPCTYMAALAASAQKGVLIKEGKYLEEMGRVTSIAFDKTGTLSNASFGLLHFNVVGQTSRTRKEVFGYLALMETPASHPLSNAIVKGAANEQIDVPKLQMQNHTLLPGEGITATIVSKDVHVGNRKLFQRLSHYEKLPDDVKVTTEKWEKSGGTVGFISIEGEGIVGAYCVVDEIRDEAKGVVEALKMMGIEIIMLTGDQRSAAINIGKQLGLEECDIKSDLLPEEKMTEIADKVKENHHLQKKAWCWNNRRAVMMVGDGVNDAPALSIADVSVAMGEGAAIAMDTADITLMHSDLNKLLYSIRMGRRVIRTIIENVIFSLIVKAIVLGFAVTGRASLWAAVGSDLGSMLAVTLNGTKLLSSSSQKEKTRTNNGIARSYSEEAISMPTSEVSPEMSIHSRMELGVTA